MPIRLNLLAEPQAQEELRRKDPAKRAMWAGIAAVAAMLGWCISLQMGMFIVKAEVSRLEGQVNARASEFSTVQKNQKELAEIKKKAASLHELATSRFLQASVLNALQRTVVDDVQLRRFKSEQAYVITPGSKAITNSTKVIPGKPTTTTERVVVTLEAQDSGNNAGDQVGKYKKQVSESEYIKRLLGATNEVRLTSLSPPSATPGGKPSVAFTLECRLPERTRL